MGDRSSIEWTEATWNPVTGCDRVSPGCDHCYALTLAARLKAMGSPKYQHDGDPRTSGPGFGVTLHPDELTAPRRWRRPRRVFVNSMSDLSVGVGRANMTACGASPQVKVRHGSVTRVRRLSCTSLGSLPSSPSGRGDRIDHLGSPVDRAIGLPAGLDRRERRRPVGRQRPVVHALQRPALPMGPLLGPPRRRVAIDDVKALDLKGDRCGPGRAQQALQLGTTGVTAPKLLEWWGQAAEEFVLPSPALVQVAEVGDRQPSIWPQQLSQAAQRCGLVVQQVDRGRHAHYVERSWAQGGLLGVHDRDRRDRRRATARIERTQPFRGLGDHRLGQVDAENQAVRADPASGLKQRGAGAAGHVEHPHSGAHASVGHQPPGDLVQEPGLVVAGGDPAEQAGDLVGLVDGSSLAVTAGRPAYRLRLVGTGWR
jgi:hypothetical protein